MMRKLASVSSDSTTPQPKVSCARLRSITTISWAGSRSCMAMAKYSPAGPPPRQAMRMATSMVEGVLPACPRLGKYFKHEILGLKFVPARTCALDYRLRARGRRAHARGVSMPEPASRRPAVVFLHGIGGSAQVWAPPLPAFAAAGFPPPPPALTGHGAPPARAPTGLHALGRRGRAAPPWPR